MYSSPTIVRLIKSIRIRWAGHVARMGWGETCTGFWWGKAEGKRPLGRPRRGWENNIKMDLQKVLRLVRGEACTGFWWGDLRERDHGGDPGVDGRIILRWIFRKYLDG
jgi:hypothetical protein